MIKTLILIIIIIFLFICSKSNNVENFYFEKSNKYKHKKFYKIILKNEVKTKSKKNAKLIIKTAYNKKSFEIENKNSIITGNVDILKFDKKDNLWKILVKKYGVKKASTIVPESRVIKEDNYKKFIDDNKNTFFIIKKNIEDGKGLFISNNKEVLIKKINDNKKTKRPFVVIQKILKNPLLIDNKTFKIRMYLTITCKNKEVNIFLSKYGFIAYSKNNWDYSNVNFENVMASPHWNEDYLLKSKGNYNQKLKKLKDEYNDKPIFIEDFKKHIEAKGKDYKKIFNEIKKKSLLIFNSIKLNNKYNSFIVTGIDLIFDENYNPYILEFNRSPGTTPYNFIKELKDKEFNQKLDIYNDSLQVMFPDRLKNKKSIYIL